MARKKDLTYLADDEGYEDYGYDDYDEETGFLKRKYDC
jgi:hypothetical protein